MMKNIFGEGRMKMYNLKEAMAIFKKATAREKEMIITLAPVLMMPEGFAKEFDIDKTDIRIALTLSTNINYHCIELIKELKKEDMDVEKVEVLSGLIRTTELVLADVMDKIAGPEEEKKEEEPKEEKKEESKISYKNIDEKDIPDEIKGFLKSFAGDDDISKIEVIRIDKDEMR